MFPPGLRLARADEAGEIAALVDAAYGHYVARLGRRPGPMLDDHAARIAAGEVFVLERPGLPEPRGIVGVLVLLETPSALLLHNIALLPAVQKQGLGTVLMAFVEAEARRRGHAAIDLYTHALMVENQARYRHLGYVETRRSSESGFERVYMTKRL